MAVLGVVASVASFLNDLWFAGGLLLVAASVAGACGIAAVATWLQGGATSVVISSDGISIDERIWRWESIECLRGVPTVKGDRVMLMFSTTDSPSTVIPVLIEHTITNGEFSELQEKLRCLFAEGGHQTRVL
jgi:hypothetical protein